MNSPPIEYYRDVLNGLPQHIAVIDSSGNLEWVNEAWRIFSDENGGDDKRTGVPTNYIEVCDRAAQAGDEAAAEISRGLRELAVGESSDLYYEYPCHSPTETRWFLMRAKPLPGDAQGSWIISHENITERRFAEHQLEELAVTDSLTSLANRRRFDDFLDAELRRSERAEQPLSLLLLDIDFFKPYNDHYGHVEGDDCLQKIASAIQTAAKRPSDLVARYGGEEFAIVLAQTGEKGAVRIAEDALQRIRDEKLPNEGAGAGKHVTASIGLVSVTPNREMRPEDLIEKADEALYQSKEAGRDRLTVYKA